MLCKIRMGFLCFIFAFTNVFVAAQAQAGVGHGGGGDEIGLDFQSSVAMALENLKARDQALYQQVEALDLNSVLVQARFLVVDESLEVKYKDIIQNSTATNDPDTGLILINRKRWVAITNEHLKQGIALHEILSLKGVESTGNYPISSRYVTLMGTSQGELQDHTKAKQVSLEIKVANLTIRPERKMDILFVVDNSGSMQSSQINLAQGIGSFINRLKDSSIDFHMAVTGTDAWRALYQSNVTNQNVLRRFRPGEINFTTNPLLYRTNSGTFVAKATTPNLVDVLRTNLNQGVTGTGDERAFESFQRALEFEGNADFRRQDAFLSIVIVSDEDDFSSNSSAYLPGQYLEETNADPMQLPPSSDPSNLYNLYHNPKLAQVSQFRDYLEKLAGTGNYSVSSIAILDNLCKAQLNSEYAGRRLGRRYLELTDTTQGYKGSICSMPEAMNGYSDYLTSTVTVVPTKYEIKLDKKPLVETIVVKINGKWVPHDADNGWSYDDTTSTLILSGTFVPKKDDIVSINYDFVN